MNIGEDSEIYLKSFLLKAREQGTSVGPLGKISELSDDANLASLVWKNEANEPLKKFDIVGLKNTLSVGKNKGSSKSDVVINGISYSVKEVNGSPPAIINHTTRPGFERVCNQIGAAIDKLDNIVEEYWKLRESGKIMEDTKTQDNLCPFKRHKKFMEPIINYFLFTGTGSYDSNHPADKVLELNYKDLPSSLKITEKHDCFDEIWDNLIFSIRNKGMPPNYPVCKCASSISKWTKFRDNVNKGSLHVRVG